MNTNNLLIFRDVEISFNRIRVLLPGQLKRRQGVCRSVMGGTSMSNNELSIGDRCSIQKQEGHTRKRSESHSELQRLQELVFASTGLLQNET